MAPGWEGYNTVDQNTHRLLARWAADCAERVLPYFETERPDDARPRVAIEAARAWADGEVTVGEVIQLGRAAHAAARETEGTAAREAARAAGHAVATGHVDGHAIGAPNYALKAVAAVESADVDAHEREREWQSARLPSALRNVVTYS